MEGVPLPPDEERCRRRGTPNWRCPQRALPGKSHCLKHYLFYVSRRHRQKTTEGGGGGERISGGGSSVEPYRPVIDFDLQKPPVLGLVNDESTLPGGAGWTGEMIMGRFGDVDLWNAGSTLGEPTVRGSGGERSEPRSADGIELKLANIYPDGCFSGLDVINDRIALGGERYEPRPSDGIELQLTSICPNVIPEECTRGSGVANDQIALGGERYEPRPYDGIELELTSIYPNVTPSKRGRPKGSKSKKKGTTDCDESVQNPTILEHDHDDDEMGSKRRENLRWIMRDRQFSDSEKDDDDDDDDQRARTNLVAHKFGELPTIFNSGNYTILPKKRGRPKGSKNKQKIHSL